MRGSIAVEIVCGGVLLNCEGYKKILENMSKIVSISNASKYQCTSTSKTPRIFLPLDAIILHKRSNVKLSYVQISFENRSFYVQKPQTFLDALNAQGAATGSIVAATSDSKGTIHNNTHE